MSAVTQNDYTQQNNTTVLYNFTFPYLKTSDVKVSLDGVVTTAFTLANATTIQLNSVPTTGTKIRIFRETGIDDLTATFYAGSAIKSEDLNDNFTQNLFVTQEVNQRFLNTLGGTKMINNLQMGEDTDIIFEGATDNDHETTLSVVDPTADQTYRLPNLSTGTYDLVSTGDTGTVARAMIANDAINGTKIADDSIDSEHYVDGSIDTQHIAADQITNALIADDQIDSEHYVAGSIDHEHLANDIIDGDNIVDDAIGNEHIATNAVNADSVANNAIDTNAIQNLAVTNGKLADNAVTQAKMADDSIGAAEIIDNAVGSAALASNAVTNLKMADNSVGTSEIVNDAVVTDKIADNAVTMDKLANGSLPTDITIVSANITNGTIVEADIADDAVTANKIADGALDGRYYTETELLNGALDGRYYTETEAEAKFLRQDSSETIASGVTWSNSDAFVATTAAINARIIDLVDDIGGFTTIANELSFPNTNPQGTTGQAAIMSIGALSQSYTPSGTTVTIANGTVGNSTVTLTGVPSALPAGFGILVESTSTLNTYTFHRLVPKATEVTTVAANATAIAAAGNNVTDINNFADLYQIGNSAPTTRADNSSLQEGDLWYDSSNDNIRVYTGSAFAAVTPTQQVLDDIAIVSGAVTYSEDLGLITDAASTGSSNGSLDIVADALEDEVTFTITAATGKFIIDGVDKPALTLYKGWTYTFDVSDASNANHPLRFYAGSSQYSTNVTVTGTQGQSGAKVQIVIPESQPSNFQYYCTNHSGMGNTITVKDDPIKTVSDNITSITGVAGNSSNINSVHSNATNINAVQANASNINAAVSNASNINSAVSNATNINTVAGAISNVNSVATNISNVNSVNSNETNINSAVSNASNINSVAGSISNVNTVASNLSNVNSFANIYRIASSAPTSSLDQGDLYFDTTSNELRVYNGSSWQGGVTATGNLAGLGANTFTGNQTINANIIVSGTVDGVDIAAFKTSFDNLSTDIVNDTTPQLGGALDGQNNNLSNIGTIDGANLQLDFGTL